MRLLAWTFLHTRDWWPAYGVPTTCPRCFYSGYCFDFMDVKLSDGLKKQIVRDRVLRPLELITNGAKSGNIDNVVKRDLIAQVYKLRGLDNLKLAKQYLTVSWAIRRMSDPIKYLPDNTMAEPILSVQER